MLSGLTDAAIREDCALAVAAALAYCLCWMIKEVLLVCTRFWRAMVSRLMFSEIQGDKYNKLQAMAPKGKAAYIHIILRS